MSEDAVQAAEFAFELGWKLSALEAALGGGGPARRPAAREEMPPPPPGRQRFTLIHCPVGEHPGFGDPRYEGLRAGPPEGCEAEDVGGYFGLRCERPGARLLDAVAETCREIRSQHGLLMSDLGVGKLWEWSQDGTDGRGAELVGQLLLMAAERGPKLGYNAEDLVRFLRTAAC